MQGDVNKLFPLAREGVESRCWHGPAPEKIRQQTHYNNEWLNGGDALAQCTGVLFSPKTALYEAQGSLPPNSSSSQEPESGDMEEGFCAQLLHVMLPLLSNQTGNVAESTEPKLLAVSTPSPGGGNQTLNSFVDLGVLRNRACSAQLGSSTRPAEKQKSWRCPIAVGRSWHAWEIWLGASGHGIAGLFWEHLPDSRWLA